MEERAAPAAAGIPPGAVDGVDVPDEFVEDTFDEPCKKDELRLASSGEVGVESGGVGVRVEGTTVAFFAFFFSFFFVDWLGDREPAAVGGRVAECAGIESTLVFDVGGFLNKFRRTETPR